MAHQLGLEIETVLSYQASGEPAPAEVLREAGTLSAGDVEYLGDRPLEEIQRRVCAEVPLRTGRQTEAVSISFLSALPGFLLLGEPLSAHGVKLVFRRLSEKLGIKIHPHKLRHIFSTDFLNHGGSVADLQRILGHESPQMSLYYAHITNNDAIERQKSNSVVDRQWQRVK